MAENGIDLEKSEAERKALDRLRRERDRKHRKNIWLYVIMSGIIVCLIVVAFSFLYRLVEEKAIEDVEITSLESSASVGRYILQSASIVEFSASAIENQIAHGAGEKEIREYLTDEKAVVEKILEGNTTGVFAYAFDEVIGAEVFKYPEGYEPVDRPWYVAAKNANGGLAMSVPYTDQRTGDEVISIVKLLDDGKSVVGMHLALEPLQEKLDNLLYEEVGEFAMIVDASGNVVSHSDKRDSEDGESGIEKTDSQTDSDVDETTYADPEWVKENVLSKLGEEDSVNLRIKIDGENYILFAQRVYLSWYAVTAVRESELYKTLNYMYFLLLLVIAIAAVVLGVAFRRITKRVRDLEKSNTRIGSMADIYIAMYDIDLLDDTFTELKSTDAIREYLREYSVESDVVGALRRIAVDFSDEQSKIDMEKFVNFETLEERLQKTNTCYLEFLTTTHLWCRARFILAGKSQDGSIYHLIFAIENIDNAKRKENRLLYLSETDLMTGIRNRGSGESEVRRHLLNHDAGLFCLLDVDKFKSVNDVFGHDVGDKTLIAVADAMKSAFRENDTVMRLGGDEFAAFATGITDEEIANRVISRLIGCVHDIDIPELMDREISVSIGAVFVGTDDNDDFDTIYKRADLCTYLSKKQSGSSVTFYSEKLEEESVGENEKEQDVDVTALGNPRKPEGDYGVAMLHRMNESHYELTGWALGYLDVKEKDDVLDIGCGGGMTLKRMSAMVGDGHLIGIDYSPVAVKESLRMNSEDVLSGKMEVLNNAVEKMPFANDRFDKIITVESFYFWPNPEENLKEVYRVLRKGGRFMIVAEVYDKPDMSEKHREEIEKYNLTNPTKERFEEMLKAAGFSECKVHVRKDTDWICVEGLK